MTLLAFDGVFKSYRRGTSSVMVLKDVSLELHAGELTGLWGPSRSGKTTLLRLACGLEQPDAGRVLYRGRDIGGMSANEAADHLRLETAWVWTGSHQFESDDVMGFVALPLFPDGFSVRAARARSLDMLELLDVQHCRYAALHELSGGERLRVTLAQALVREPNVVLIDEPSAHLEHDERSDLVQVIRTIAADRFIAVLVTATHAFDLVGVSSTHTISAGRLIAPRPRNGAAGGEVVPLRRAQPKP